MEKKISIIGGDERIVKFAEIACNDGAKIATFLLENAIFQNENIQKCSDLMECIKFSDIVISSIPLSKDGINVYSNFSNEKLEISTIKKFLDKKIFIAGKISSELKSNQNIKCFDLMENEEFTILNTIPSAEGAIQVAMENYSKTINSSKILIMGFGRIGKILARMLTGFGCTIYCEARKKEDLAYIKAYGYNAIDLKNINEILGEIDIIFNTIPVQILNSEKLDLLKKNVLIVDLASNPGGIDFDYAKEKNINTVWALALPGKVAPESSAEYIKNILDDIIKF